MKTNCNLATVSAELWVRTCHCIISCPPALRFTNQPGSCGSSKAFFFKFVGKVWFTINAKIYTGEENVCTDWSVAAPIIGISIPLVAAPIIGSSLSSPTVNVGELAANHLEFGTTRGIVAVAGSEGFGTELRFSPTVGEMSADKVGQVLSKCTLSSPGWYCGSDRTLYICGGPSASEVQRESEAYQRIDVEGCELPALYLTEECPAGFTAID